MDESFDSRYFSARVHLALLTCICEGGTSFFKGHIFKKFREFLFMFSTGFASFGISRLFPLSITICLFARILMQHR